MPFSVKITHDRMVIARLTETVPQIWYSIALQPEFSRLSFHLKDNGVFCHNSGGADFMLETESKEGSSALLNELTTSWLAYEKKKRLTKRTSWILLLMGIVAALLVTTSHYLFSEKNAAATHRHRIHDDSAAIEHLQEEPAISEKTPIAETNHASIVHDDGWMLEKAERGKFAEKLKNAAENKLFSVNYSQGHARTLYVFADPNCPNCQRLEPTLNLAAQNYNVVVFPVAVIGKEKSVEEIASVLCLSPEKRKVAWDRLYDMGSDVLGFGQEVKIQDNSHTCDLDQEVAKQAIGVNEVAWKVHQIPGTPWIISDDGRHVPQSMLKDPLSLSAFLKKN